MEQESKRVAVTDWEQELDKNWVAILDTVEKYFSSLIKARRETGETIPNISIERYHGDGFDIIFRWQGEDSIERNIQAFISGVSIKEATTDLRLSVFVHAWKDVVQLDGSGIRNSHYEEVAHLAFGTTQIHSVFDHAYTIVSSWSEKDLAKQSTLTALPREYQARFQ